MTLKQKLVGLVLFTLLLVGSLLMVDINRQAGGFAELGARDGMTALPSRSSKGSMALGLQLSELDHAALFAKAKELEKEKGIYRFATQRQVAVDLNSHGQWWAMGDGRVRWEFEVKSEGAESLNFGFSEFVLPPGAALALIGGEDGTRHVFTERDNDEHGELWTPLFRGESVKMELEVSDQLAPMVVLELASVNHGFRGLTDKAAKIGNGSSGSCNIDVVCSAADDSGFGPLVDMYRDQIRAVGAYTLNGIDTCSGTLINNTSNDAKPYFLTANHCGISSGNAASMVVYWNFENTTCRTPGSAASGANGDGPITQFNSGAIFRATSSNSDFTLVELDDAVSPAVNAFYAGWDRTGVNPSSVIGIHHPAVAEKRISFELDQTTTTGYSSNTVNSNGTHIRVIDWDYGTTEGGSSGSALFNDSGLIIGQLHGGGAACGNNQSDWYGRLSVSWAGGGTSATRLSNWLDPTGTGVTSLAGINSSDSISIAGTSLNEGNAGNVSATVTLSLSVASSQTVSVRVRSVAGGTATSGVDYLPLDTVVTFTPGQTQRTATLLVIGDTVPEGNETVRLELSDPVNASITGGTADVVILNDDVGPPTITSALSIVIPVGAPMGYQIAGANMPTQFGISSGPSGMSVNPFTGVLAWTPLTVGNYTVEISVANSAGSDAATLSIEVVASDLVVALDLEGAFVPVDGGEPWVRQTAVTHDGEDAARSGEIGDNQSSSFSIDVEGPDVVSFWWKVSSESSYDYLRLQMDGNTELQISGEVDWEQVTFNVPVGSHTLVWVYAKDQSVTSGSDYGWVDELMFASGSPEPMITSGASLVTFSGAQFYHQIVASNLPTLYGGTNLPAGLTVDSLTGVVSGVPSGIGPWSFELWAENADGRGTQEVTVTETALDLNLAVAADEELAAIVNDVNEPWFVDTGAGSNGGSSARSGDIGNNQASQMEMYVEGPGQLSFDWQVSSESGYDFLRVSLDGVELEAISGTVTWTTVTVDLLPGSHVITWIFDKDNSVSSGSDAGWVDDIELGGYAGFVTAAGLVGGSAKPGVNLDGDLYPNLMEYVLGGDPNLISSPVGPALVTGSGGVTCSYSGLAVPVGVSVYLEESDSLLGISWNDSGITPSQTATGGGMADFDFAIPLGAGMRNFYRLTAEFVEP